MSYKVKPYDLKERSNPDTHTDGENDNNQVMLEDGLAKVDVSITETDPEINNDTFNKYRFIKNFNCWAYCYVPLLN